MTGKGLVSVPLVEAVIGVAGELGAGDAAYLPFDDGRELGPFAWRTICEVRPGASAATVEIVTAEGPTHTMSREKLISHVPASARTPLEAA